jgi:regulator of sirC expression with transglutaminase-like and TPR domain
MNTNKLPLCCSPRAFELLSQQVESIDSPDALQGFADQVRGRVRGAQPQAVMAHLHQFLFDEKKFRGNTDDYYNPRNSYLPAVLDSKQGLPITLCLIYKLVAERLGLRCWGVGLPGHFLVAVADRGPESATLVDPFTGGRLLTSDEAHDRMKEMFGPEVEWSEEMLRPASNRHWLTRMLQNLLNVFGSAGHFSDVAAVLEMEMLLWPEHTHLQRDLGLVLARCGLSRPASIWLDRYLQQNPDDPQKKQLKELLQVLGS